MRNALIIATVGGFLKKFEMGNVRILQEMGCRVHYAANMENQIYRFDPGDLENAGVQMHHIDIRKSPYDLASHRKAAEKLVEIIRREEIELIHGHTPVGGYLGRVAGEKSGRPGLRVIYTSHGFHFYEGAPRLQSAVFRSVEKRLAEKTDVIITINKEDYQKACRFRLKPGGQVYRIPGVGLDTAYFRPPETAERMECRSRLGIPDDTLFLLSAGELNQNKNHKTLLLAMHEYIHKGKDKKRIFCGICGEGPARRSLEAEILRLGLDQNVALYGYCDSVREYLAGADSFVFPSRREGLGMAALEALAMGIPVLAADNRGTREYMKPGENGYLYDWRDAAGFAEGIRRMKEQKEEERNAMKIFCRESAEPFAKEKTEAIMKKIYKTVLQTPDGQTEG